MTLGIEDVRRALDRPSVPYATDRAMFHAAVAVVVLPGLDLLFMRRADRVGDPWSGHIAFPGGRVDPVDESPLHAAMRESEEELGLHLRVDQLVGKLDEVGPLSGYPLVVHPYVFALDAQPEIRMNAEVASVHPYSLEALLRGDGRGDFPFEHGGARYQLPRVDFDGVRLWGLTLRIVDDLLARLAT